MNPKQYIQKRQKRINKVLVQRLPKVTVEPSRLHSAMRYAVLNGGKRLRPTLVYATGESFGATPKQLDAAACAVEFIHAYSLIHDDLPAMDNDDLRRGQPTCHKAFDEATAILAGDALQTLAFQVLTTDTTFSDSNQRLRMIATLAHASSSSGMAGGQALDLAATGKQMTLDALENIYRLKTGALLQASVLLGAIAANQNNADTLSQLSHYATCLGLAFQIQDDILDIEGKVETIGKSPGSDQARGQPTYPITAGVSTAKEKIQELYTQALADILQFGSQSPLRLISEYLIARDC